MTDENELVEAQVIDKPFNIASVGVATIVGVLGQRAVAVPTLVEGVAVMLPPQYQTHDIPGSDTRHPRCGHSALRREGRRWDGDQQCPSPNSADAFASG
jgi:hypothetical protein